MSVTIIRGDATAMPLADASVHAVVCDPPYSIGFLGKAWDSFQKCIDPITGNVRPWANGSKAKTLEGKAFQEWCELWGRECLRVLKPGGHLIAFGATRAYHRMACGVEDAGFEIRDSGLGAWTYFSGFPKSHDAAKAIDKTLGAKRERVKVPAVKARRPGLPGGGLDEVIGGGRPFIDRAIEQGFHEMSVDKPVTPEAEEWDGWGTALKPAIEPFVIARKPMGTTVARCLMEHGTGAINVDGCRIPMQSEDVSAHYGGKMVNTTPGHCGGFGPWYRTEAHDAGRWPSNLVVVGDLLADNSKFFDVSAAFPLIVCEKPNKTERGTFNSHETVKPVRLMRWLIRLVTKLGQTVLDPFAGSGTTGVAALAEGRNALLIEKDDDGRYLPIIRARLVGAESIDGEGRPVQTQPRLPFGEVSA